MWKPIEHTHSLLKKHVGPVAGGSLESAGKFVWAAQGRVHIIP